MRISDWSSDVCSSDLLIEGPEGAAKLNQAMLLPPGRQLEDILGTPLFRRTLDALAPLGVPAAALQGFKPWALSIFLVFPPLEVARLARGGQIGRAHV